MRRRFAPASWVVTASSAVSAATLVLLVLVGTLQICSCDSESPNHVERGGPTLYLEDFSNSDGTLPPGWANLHLGGSTRSLVVHGGRLTNADSGRAWAFYRGQAFGDFLLYGARFQLSDSSASGAAMAWRFSNPGDSIGTGLALEIRNTADRTWHLAVVAYRWAAFAESATTTSLGDTVFTDMGGVQTLTVVDCHDVVRFWFDKTRAFLVTIPDDIGASGWVGLADLGYAESPQFDYITVLGQPQPPMCGHLVGVPLLPGRRPTSG